MRKYQFSIAASILILDRITKWLVMKNLPYANEVSVIPGLFQLSHWENTGAAFSMFADSSSPWRTAGLISFSLIAIATVAFFHWRHGDKLDTTALALSLILGGAAGNLWDRIAKGTVTDFLDFYIGQHHWPPFNIADSGIVAGGILLAWMILFARDPQAAN